jgi:hypothetical protein
MNRFKVGDIVRLIRSDQLAAECGAIGRVTGQGNDYLQIEWVQNHRWHGQMNGGYYRTSFTVVKHAPTLKRRTK